jgi:asparagine synthase (glutamine-hydrolysing)
MSLLGQMSNSRVLKKYGPLMNAKLDDYYLSRASSPYQYFNRATADIYSAGMWEHLNKNQATSVSRNLISSRSADGLLEKMLYVDTKSWLPDDLLIKADRMTMANSVELRVPFLDHKVLEFAARLPRNQKIRGWKMKYLLKKALSKHVPAEILYRRKVGFPVPYATWLRTDLNGFVADTLLDSKATSRGYFQRATVEKLIKRNKESGGYAKEVFSLVVLELWHRTFLDTKYTESNPRPGLDMSEASISSI